MIGRVIRAVTDRNWWAELRCCAQVVWTDASRKRGVGVSE